MILLDPILGLRRLNRLPLHIGRRVGASLPQRADVVDHVPGTAAGAPAGRGTWMAFLEAASRPRASLDAALGIAGAPDAF